MSINDNDAYKFSATGEVGRHLTNNVAKHAGDLAYLADRNEKDGVSLAQKIAEEAQLGQDKRESSFVRFGHLKERLGIKKHRDGLWKTGFANQVKYEKDIERAKEKAKKKQEALAKKKAQKEKEERKNKFA